MEFACYPGAKGRNAQQKVLVCTRIRVEFDATPVQKDDTPNKRYFVCTESAWSSDVTPVQRDETRYPKYLSALLAFRLEERYLEPKAACDNPHI